MSEQIHVNENEVVLKIKHPTVRGTPADELRLICKNIKKIRASQKLFSSWPNLRTASYNLVEFLTVYWPDPHNRNMSLLEACLEKAFDMTETLYKERADDVEVQKAFIRIVTEELAVSMQYSLMIRSKSRWLLHEVNKVFLSEVIRDKGVTSLIWTNDTLPGHNGEQSKVICASRVFTLKELELIGLMN